MKFRSTFKTPILCQLPDNHSFQGYSVHHTVNHIVPRHIWVRHSVRNVDPPHLRFPFPVGLPPSSLCSSSFQCY